MYNTLNINNDNDNDDDNGINNGNNNNNTHTKKKSQISKKDLMIWFDICSLFSSKGQERNSKMTFKNWPWRFEIQFCSAVIFRYFPNLLPRFACIPPNTGQHLSTSSRRSISLDGRNHILPWYLSDCYCKSSMTRLEDIL